MKHGFIVSTPHLQEFALASDYHLTLAHLMIKPDTPYERFYRAVRNRGHFVTLDNSYFELGYSFDYRKLVEIGIRIHVNELVAPEGRNFKENIKVITKFLRYLEKKKLRSAFKVAGVVKVNCMEQVWSTIRHFEEMGIDTICFPYMNEIDLVSNEKKNVLSKTKILVQNRINLMGVLFDAERDLKMDIHLLGLSCPSELKRYNELNMLDKIRSNDSSCAFWHGVYGVKLHKEYGLVGEKIKDKVNFEYKLRYDFQKSCVNHNISVILDFVKQQDLRS